jgi:hypothetical protein
MFYFIVMFDRVNPVNNLAYSAFCACSFSLMTGIFLGIAISEDGINPLPTSSKHMMMDQPKHTNYGACMMMKSSGTEVNQNNESL